MGQKVNPIGFRLAVNKDWRSKWYATGQDYATKLHEDLVMRKYIKEQLMSAAVSSIVIERAWNSVRITVHTARPGLVIGRKGEEIEKIRQYLQGLCGASTQVNIDIVEIRSPETDAQLIAENVAVQLERRVSFRRAMKQAIQRATRLGAKGIKCTCGGRLGGAEIARTEHYHEGTIPLQTLRADIDYGFAEAATTYGRIGVKVWIYKGEVLHGGPRLGRSIEAPKPAFERRERRGGRDDRRGGRRDFNRGERRAPRQEGGNR